MRIIYKLLEALLANREETRHLRADIQRFRLEWRREMSALSDAVQAVKDDVVRIGDGVERVLALLTQPNPDVDAAVTALQAVDAALDATAEALEAAVPAEPAE